MAKKKITCKQCGKEFIFEATGQEQRIKCPGCQKIYIVKGAASQPPKPIAQQRQFQGNSASVSQGNNQQEHKSGNSSRKIIIIVAMSVLGLYGFVRLIQNDEERADKFRTMKSQAEEIKAQEERERKIENERRLTERREREEKERKATEERRMAELKAKEAAELKVKEAEEKRAAEEKRLAEEKALAEQRIFKKEDIEIVLTTLLKDWRSGAYSGLKSDEYFKVYKGKRIKPIVMAAMEFSGPQTFTIDDIEGTNKHATIYVTAKFRLKRGGLREEAMKFMVSVDDEKGEINISSIDLFK